MKRIFLILGILFVSTVSVAFLDKGSATAQSQSGRCSVYGTGGAVDVSVELTSAVMAGGPGGGPRVLGRVDVVSGTGASAPAVSFHAITTRGMGANDRSAGTTETVEVCSSSSAPPTAARSTCAISGEAPGQTAIVALLLPAVQRREASQPSLSERQTGSSLSASYEISLVPTGPAAANEIRVPCDAAVSRRGQPPRAGYDIAIIKK
jgi:hypothetical protein